MTKPPRRRIEPLEPPPDAFDRVLSRARVRRRRHALVVASSTMVIVLVSAVSFALGASLNQKQRFNNAADQQHQDGSTAAASAKSSASQIPKRKKHKPTPATRTTTATVPPPGSNNTISWLRGRAVDANGNGIGGLSILPGNPDHTTFSSNGTVLGITGPDGSYKIRCPRAPVLLATWQLNASANAASTGDKWAATFVEGSNGIPATPSCGIKPHVTTVPVGATLTGTVHVADTCSPDATFPVWVWLYGDRGATVRIAGLHDGDTFTFRGMPAGSHILGARGKRSPISLALGATAEHDASFTCEQREPTDPSEPTEEPTETATPTVTPTPTATPTPTLTP
jgi:hypothetical protein